MKLHNPLLSIASFPVIGWWAERVGGARRLGAWLLYTSLLYLDVYFARRQHTDVEYTDADMAV